MAWGSTVVAHRSPAARTARWLGFKLRYQALFNRRILVGRRITLLPSVGVTDEQTFVAAARELILCRRGTTIGCSV
jgi:hypothetical protein